MGNAFWYPNRLGHIFIKGLLLFLLLTSYQANSQSYFYFEYKLKTADAQPLTYYTFLSVDANGTATARTLYKDPGTNEKRLVKQNFTDSSTGVANDTASGATQYLVPVGNAYGLDGTAYPAFVKQRFLFTKQLDGQDFFYTPTGIEYTTGNSNWQPAVLTANQQKTFAELSGQKPFISLFYGKEEPFYKALFEIGTRGLNDVDRKTKLWLVAVANTTDLKISSSTQKDLDKMTGFFTQMAAGLGITLLTKSISGAAFGKTAVNDAINNWLKPAPTDIVVFYYSGHGFRYASDSSAYPRMSLRTDSTQDLSVNNESVEALYSRILKKGARVNMVLTDCCNNRIDDPVPIGKLPLKTKDPATAPLNFNTCKTLFFPNYPLSILASSAEVGQLAICNPALGGFFTNFFQAQLQKSLYGTGGESSWLQILLNAKESARWQALSAMCGSDRCVQRAVVSVVPPQ